MSDLPSSFPRLSADTRTSNVSFLRPSLLLPGRRPLHSTPNRDACRSSHGSPRCLTCNPRLLEVAAKASPFLVCDHTAFPDPVPPCGEEANPSRSQVLVCSANAATIASTNPHALGGLIRGVTDTSNIHFDPTMANGGEYTDTSNIAFDPTVANRGEYQRWEPVALAPDVARNNEEALNRFLAEADAKAKATNAGRYPPRTPAPMPRAHVTSAEGIATAREASGPAPAQGQGCHCCGLESHLADVCPVVFRSRHSGPARYTRPTARTTHRRHGQPHHQEGGYRGRRGRRGRTLRPSPSRSAGIWFLRRGGGGGRGGGDPVHGQGQRPQVLSGVGL